MKTVEQMTNKELLNEYKTYEDLIYGKNPCFGTKDIRFFDSLCYEMDKREGA
jgi:hypothetical protein